MPRYRSSRPIDPELGPRLRKAREALPLARERASAALGVDVETLANWEAGRTEPRCSELVKLALLYKQAPSDLLGVTQ